LLFAALAVGTGALLVSCSLLNKPAPIKAGTGGGGGGSCTMASDCLSAGPLAACQVPDCQNGKCATKNADDGTMCDDGKFCSATMSGTCQAGVCTGVTPKVCTGATACMVSDCNEAAKTCGTKAASDGIDCGAGPDVCTAHAACQTGTCTMPPKKCESQTTDCMDVVCDTTSKNCMSTPKNANMQCQVGQPCKDQGVCTATGICGPDPSNPTGFTGMNKADGTCCDDLLSCTLGDSCKAGVCKGVSICPADTACVKYKCTEPPPPAMGMPPTPGVCTTITQNDGMPCLQSTCTTGQTCSMGACQGGTVSSSVLFFEDFHDNSKMWALGPQWQIGPAKGSDPLACQLQIPGRSQDPPYDHTRKADNGVAGVVIGGNEDNLSMTSGPYPMQSCLVSPTIDTSSAVGNLNLTYYRWLNSDFYPYMIDTVDVSTDNGATWAKNCYTNPPAAGGNPTVTDTPNVGGGGWSPQQCEITAQKSATMKIRFCFTLNQPGVYSVGSWNVDDVTISAGQTCF
jgi:hypothetical protein